jgi:hypothetical protein
MMEQKGKSQIGPLDLLVAVSLFQKLTLQNGHILLI